MLRFMFLGIYCNKNLFTHFDFGRDFCLNISTQNPLQFATKFFFNINVLF